MGVFTTYCAVSGCTPEVATSLSYPDPDIGYGPIVTSALNALADQHELSSQNDICVIGPIHPSGQPYEEGLQDGALSNNVIDLDLCDLRPTDIRVVPHCEMSDSWDVGFVDPPPALKRGWSYSIGLGCSLMVQTFALDVLALATRGRMTPLRLWRLAMKQGHGGEFRDSFQGVKYGKRADQWPQSIDEFPGLTKRRSAKIETTGDVEVAKRALVHGYPWSLWMWLAPDRFPVSQSEDGQPLSPPDVRPPASRLTMKNLPAEVLTRMSLLNLAGTSQFPRTEILGDDDLACEWLYKNAPWWIPVPTRTPKGDDQRGPSTSGHWVYPASEWSAHVPLTTGFPTGLDWAYVWRCMRSGSMRNRERIWNVALDIERVADMEGV